ncbi:MAG: PilN domain-containing protein [Burkholderiales bacterium]|nr:PilN domain-containing protein [Burkholderiales bacterium]
MILINLLPHREAARKRRKDAFNVSLGVSALAGGLIAGIVFLWLQSQTASQEGLNTLLGQEIQKLDNQIKDIAALEAEIAALQARQQAVENLQADRNMPVQLLTELTRQFPEGVYITSMRQENQLISLQGTAQSNERVSELLRNLAYHSPWFSKPELIEIVAASATFGKDQRRVANFTLRVRMLRASEVQKPPVSAAPAPPADVTTPTAAAPQPAKP